MSMDKMAGTQAGRQTGDPTTLQIRGTLQAGAVETMTHSEAGPEFFLHFVSNSERR